MGRSFGQMIKGGVRAHARSLRNTDAQQQQPEQPMQPAPGDSQQMVPQAPAPQERGPAPQLSDVDDMNVEGPVASDDLIGHVMGRDQ
jgi:hypothetical protein